MTVGITGTSGLIGFHLADDLLATGNVVIGLSRQKNVSVEDLLKYERFQFAAGDVTKVGFDTPSLRYASHSGQAATQPEGSLEPLSSVEVLYHLAAQSTIWQSKKYPVQDCRTNIFGTIAVLDFARTHGIKKVIFTSGGAVYPNQYMADENFLGPPNSFYGLSKWTGEQYCKLYAKEFGLKTTILRLARVYGPGMSRNAIYDMLIGFIEKRPIKLYTSLESKHDFIYVKDVVSALKQAINPIWDNQIVNISSGYGIALHDLYEMLCRLFGSRPDLEIVSDSVTKDALVNKKALSLGWKQVCKIEEGLKETIDWFMKQTSAK